MIHIVGHTAIDHISRVSALPAKNESSTILCRDVLFGGGAANIATGIARLGGEVTLVSAVGEDFSGSDYEAWLEKNGVCTEFYTVSGKNTPTAFMFTDPLGNQITFFEWGASEIFKGSVPPSFPFVHMATADPGFNVKVAEKADFSSFDPGQDLHRYSAEQLYSILSKISLLFANHHEVNSMCRMMHISQEDLTTMVPMAVLTSGARGSMLYQRGENEHIPAIPVRMVDPTGAGDAYRAGFLTAYTRGLPPAICCRVGTVAASYVVEVEGCQTNLSDWSMMKSRYENFFGELPLC